MTELEIKAEENCKTYLCRECNRIFECDGNVALCSKARTFCKNRLIELLQEENEELKAQIEKMKCCGNCSNYHCSDFQLVRGVCVPESWELDEW